jgi:hypothetical protein
MNCELCRAFQTRPSSLPFACSVCGQQMVEVAVPEGVALHCPAHCTTLIPSRRQIAEARRKA